MRLSPEERRKRRPATIELGDADLMLTWQDGRQSRYRLEDLRRQCPCASCREARGQPHGPTLVGAELPMLAGEAASATAEATGFEPVGRYGLRIRWADGHDAGIYTFEMLRDLDAA